MNNADLTTIDILLILFLGAIFSSLGQSTYLGIKDLLKKIPSAKPKQRSIWTDFPSQFRKLSDFQQTLAKELKCTPADISFVVTGRDDDFYTVTVSPCDKPVGRIYGSLNNPGVMVFVPNYDSAYIVF